MPVESWTDVAVRLGATNVWTIERSSELVRNRVGSTHGTVSGTWTLTNGPSAYPDGALLGGASCYIHWGSTLGSLGAGAFTLTFLYKPTNTPYHYPLGKYDDGTNGEWYIENNDTGLTFVRRNTSGGNAVVLQGFASTLTAGAWQQVAVTGASASGSHSLYVNTTAIQTLTASSGKTSGPHNFGTGLGGGGALNGESVAGWALFDTMLSSAQLGEMWTAATTISTRDDHLRGVVSG